MSRRKPEPYKENNLNEEKPESVQPDTEEEKPESVPSDTGEEKPESVPSDTEEEQPDNDEKQNININTDGDINININTEHDQNVNIEQDTEDIALSGELKSVYFSDTMKEQYYRMSWRDLCQEAGTQKTEDVKFMDIVIQNARDTHKQKNKQKKIYFFWEIFLLFLTFFNTLLNSLKLHEWSANWEMALNFSCIAVSALIAGVTSYELLIAPKSSWLRHMSFYSKITTEADNLFSGGKEYQCSAREKIDKFKSKITLYTQEDYQNFFANLSGSKNFSKNEEKNENDT